MQSSVIDDIIESPHRYSFFQAVRLLQQAVPDSRPVGHFHHPETEYVRMGNVASLSFPASEIESVDTVENDGRTRYIVRTSRLGLYGIFSPLPTVYSVSLIGTHQEDESERQRLRDFLDLFNHRILSLACRVEEYRHIHAPEPDAAPGPFYRAALSVLGFRSDGEALAEEPSLLSNLQLGSLMAFGVRSAAGLEAWLSGVFPDTPVAVGQFLPRWVRIPNEFVTSLGVSNSALGGETGQGEATVGEWILDKETKFRVTIGPLDWKGFQDYLPGSRSLDKLIAAVELFAPDWLNFDVMIKLLGSECGNLQCILDGSSSRLGYTAGLFKETGADEDLRIVLELEMATVNSRN